MFGNLREAIGEPWAELVLVLVAFACGALIGLERESKDKPAGLRTIVLICLGASVFASLSRLGLGDQGRVAAGVVTGVGFLGAGSIVRDRVTVSGVTTAATIWATAAVGMVVGSGYPLGGAGLAALVLLTLLGLKPVERRLAGPCRPRRIAIRFRSDSGKTRARLQHVVDEADGPLELGPEEVLSDELAMVSLLHCQCHRQHRALLAVIAEMAEVVALIDAQNSGS